MNMNRGVTIIFFISQAAAYYLFQYWFAYYDQFAIAVFGRTVGNELGTTVSFSNSVIGAILTPLLGPVLDRLGIFRFFIVSTITFIIFAASSLASSFDLQIVSIVASMVFFCAWMTFLTKWGTVYCPPDLFGTYFGVLFSVIGVSQMIVNLVLPPLVRHWFGKPVDVFYFFFFAYGVIGVIAAIALIVALARHPPPAIPPSLVIVEVDEGGKEGRSIQ